MNLLLSNNFITFAWQAHLKDLRPEPWDFAVLASWGGFFGYT